MVMVILVTLFLVLLTAFSQMDIRPDIIFFLMMLGQLLVIFMVYMVLTDNYTTTKTFEDWYEDHPIDKE
ncbi:hypothetical protein E7Z59_09700 [Robertkochia marina]|uniref:Uncharacterized protein n=2 Tax=Robertkochia marina TaxID=1227945 RepID=A0A4S3M0Z9_9FLAO|nr:hypothetical protein E7Z59_09700 [Robertkochia marina]TRZ41049.1 hypothetical protein D3A96_14245 [Robertkochia marina]